MRLILVFLTLLFSFNLFATDMDFSKKASVKPEIIQKGEQKAWCPVCGMSLKMFYKTNHALKLSGGHNNQYCSMSCMVHDNEGLQDIVKEILVVDASTEKLIPAYSANYVLGSKVPGTMSKVSKIAFADINDAEAFQAKMGGDIVTYSYAFEYTQKSIAKDTSMISMKRQKMMYPKGEKIFNSVCDKNVDPTLFDRINELKADIKSNNRCGFLSESELQAVALYLWDIVRYNNKSESFITIKEGEKCPVCGMFVHKYPKWASKIYYTKNGQKNHAAFDGVKDMMKFYLKPSKWGFDNIRVSEILVTDYYSNKALKAEKAFYVKGSEVYGPMGRELIPFSTMKNAETFMSDHSGGKILLFDEITKDVVYGLDK